MMHSKEDQGDDNEFVHFEEEEELGGDPEEVIEEESEEELVITERPMTPAQPQPPAGGPKPAAKKAPAKRAARPVRKAKKAAKKKAKASAKRAKRAKRPARKRGRRRRMRGGAQAQLLRCDDHGYYIVKFQNNPQHLRILVNEMLGTRLAARLGLPVPQVEVVEVRPELIS